MDLRFNDRFNNDNLPHLLNKMLKNKEEAVEKAKLESRTDHLTQVGNVRDLDESLARAVDKINSRNHKREVDPDYLLFILIDLNNFKSLNDTFGHEEGNEALRIAAESFIKETEKRGGKVFRFGGDEFVIIQEGRGDLTTSPTVIAERIQSNINTDLIDRTKGKKFEISVSVGCSILKKGEHKDAKTLREEADQAMYKSKGKR